MWVSTFLCPTGGQSLSHPRINNLCEGCFLTAADSCFHFTNTNSEGNSSRTGALMWSYFRDAAEEMVT